MNAVKKAASMGLAVLMAGSLAACEIGGNTKWVAQAGDLTVPAGVYIDLMIGSYSTITADMGADVKNPLKEDVDGVPVTDQIEEDARQALYEYIAIEQKFDEMGLTVDPADEAAVQSDVEQFWPYIGDTMQTNGVSKESYAAVYLNSIKRSLIFDAIYGEGGSEEVPESELKEKFQNDYAKIVVMPLQFTQTEDGTVSEESKQKATDLANKYLELANAGGDMQELIAQAKEEFYATEETGEESSDAESAESAGTTEEQTEPEKEDFTFVYRESSPYDETVTNAIFDAAIGTPTLVESDTGVYLFQRYDVNEDPEDFNARKSTLISLLRSDAFTQKVGEWANSLSGIVLNDAAFERYTPSRLKLG